MMACPGSLGAAVRLGNAGQGNPGSSVPFSDAKVIRCAEPTDQNGEATLLRWTFGAFIRSYDGRNPMLDTGQVVE